ncbi:hypothetical protein ADUPG1_006605 [Aduncisulcus paluster]|uniref:Phosphodiesterase n=1 Tax=Aduncisulcus paluster TaxID=2918883 RepID=A0ABQ5KIU5_9EUKA|nr:hypothetical protein ADUPG1_006605 [Aduncisulcus paluster]
MGSYDGALSCPAPASIQFIPFRVSSILHFFYLCDINYSSFAHYHNPIHGSSHIQTTSLLISRLQHSAQILDSGIPIPSLTRGDKLILLMSSAGHDMNHPGLSQAFISSYQHPITFTHGPMSTLELHHSHHTLRAMEASGMFKITDDMDFETRNSIKIARSLVSKSIFRNILSTAMDQKFDFPSHVKNFSSFLSHFQEVEFYYHDKPSKKDSSNRLLNPIILSSISSFPRCDAFKAILYKSDMLHLFGWDSGEDEQHSSDYPQAPLRFELFEHAFSSTCSVIPSKFTPQQQEYQKQSTCSNIWTQIANDTQSCFNRIINIDKHGENDEMTNDMMNHLFENCWSTFQGPAIEFVSTIIMKIADIAGPASVSVLMSVLNGIAVLNEGREEGKAMLWAGEDINNIGVARMPAKSDDKISNEENLIEMNNNSGSNNSTVEYCEIIPTKNSESETVILSENPQYNNSDSCISISKEDSDILNRLECGFIDFLVLPFVQSICENIPWILPEEIKDMSDKVQIVCASELFITPSISATVIDGKCFLILGGKTSSEILIFSPEPVFSVQSRYNVPYTPRIHIFLKKIKNNFKES